MQIYEKQCKSLKINKNALISNDFDVDMIDLASFAAVAGCCGGACCLNTRPTMSPVLSDNCRSLGKAPARRNYAPSVRNIM